MNGIFTEIFSKLSLGCVFIFTTEWVPSAIKNNISLGKGLKLATNESVCHICWRLTKNMILSEQGFINNSYELNERKNMNYFVATYTLFIS